MLPETTPPTQPVPTQPNKPQALLLCDDIADLLPLLLRFGLTCRQVPADSTIPGSYWGTPEAGLVGDTLYLSAETPLHSALHESCHFICMDQTRRARLHTDAGGDYAEEEAVCYLQIRLSDLLPGVGWLRMCADMDAWGYSFRLGSTQAWYQLDAEDARVWLIQHGILRPDGTPTWRLRQ